MAARAISSATISFGLVSIPVKLYTAASAQNVSFNQLHGECGSRVKQQLVCPGCENKVLERTDIVKGYEYSKDKYVRFEGEELKKLEDEKSSSLDIVEFVPLETVDLVYIEKSYYLGPDKGGQKAYKLLSGAMERTGKIAVGRYWTRGKTQLVLLRPYKEGLILHQVYYKDEVRDFSDVDVGDEVKMRPGEAELADQLIAQLSSETFGAEQYRDEYRDRVLSAVEQKVAGQEITVAPERPQAQIIDLFEALKASLGKTGAKADAKAEPATEEPKAKPIKKAGGGSSRKKAGSSAE